MATKHKKTVRSSVILPEEQYRKVETIAEANDVSVAWVIRLAIAELLNKPEAIANLKLKRK